MNLKDNIVIAISKGRILEEGMELLKTMGIETTENMSDSRKLIYNTNNSKLKLVIVRASDVPTYVGNGAADIGIVGKDTLVEYSANNIYIPLDLNISKTNLSVFSSGTRSYSNSFSLGRANSRILSTVVFIPSAATRPFNRFKVFKSETILNLLEIASFNLFRFLCLR